MNLFKYIKKDYYRLNNKNKPVLFIFFKSYISPSLKSVILFRLSSYFYGKKLFILSKYFYLKNIRCFGNDIHPSTSIGEGLLFPHPNGIVISGWAKLGNNITIFQQTTIGIKNLNSKSAPTIKDNCIIMAGAKLYGDITIGNNCIVGSNSVVIESFENSSVIGGIPAKLLKINNER